MRFHGIQPNRSDARGFVHKRIGGAIVGGVKGFVRGGPTGVIGGAVGGFVGGGAPAATVCPPGFGVGPGGQCVAAVGRVPGVRGFLQRVIPGGETGFQTTAEPTMFERRIRRQRRARERRGLSGVVGGGMGGLPFDIEEQQVSQNGTGQAVVGRFGAGIEPSIRMQDIRDCPRGMVLAVDDLCYNRRDLRNSERFWPRGRRPLLTGGEMRAISTAASAAKKLQRKQKDLMKLGLLKKPAARARAPSGVTGHRATLEHT